jgi:hypothetical protein
MDEASAYDKVVISLGASAGHGTIGGVTPIHGEWA